MADTPSPLLDVIIQLADGSSTAPSLAFRNGQLNGLYLKSSGVIGIGISGSEVATINSTGLASGIATGSVTADSISSTNGAVKVQKFTVGFAALNTATTGVAALFGTAIPVGAIVVRSFIRSTTSFAGNGDSGSTLKVGLQDAAATGDVHASGALSVYAAGLVEGVSTGSAATMKPVSTTAKQLAVIWTIGGTDTALTAGAMDVYVEYVGA